jgi:hypothetical protein
MRRAVVGWALVAVAPIAFLAALWGASWTVHVLSIDDWRTFPALMTIILGAAGVGTAGLVSGLYLLDDFND